MPSSLLRLCGSIINPFRKHIAIWLAAWIIIRVAMKAAIILAILVPLPWVKHIQAGKYLTIIEDASGKVKVVLCLCL
jgi:hypothetical protein